MKKTFMEKVLSNAKNITQVEKALRAYTYITSDYGKDKEYGEHNLYVKETIPEMIKGTHLKPAKPEHIVHHHKELLSQVYDECIGMLEHLRHLKAMKWNVPKLDKKLKKAEQKHLINLIKGPKQ